MMLRLVYRTSMYLMLVLATLVLSIDSSTYNPFAMLYPLGVALAALGALMTVDRNPELGLTRDLANFLALASVVLSAIEFWANPLGLPLALGHWLVYLQLVKMFLPKTTEDDWFLFLLGLVQVLVGTFLSQSEWVGTLVFLWAMVSLWSLGLFHLYREALRNVPPPNVSITPAPDPRHPYPGLINSGFVLSTLLVAASTLLLGGVIFYLVPRTSASKSAPGAPPAPRHLTGFSDEVQLGQMGEILENNRLLMTVELFDGKGRTTEPSQELLWRGVTMARYEHGGRWAKESAERPIPVARAALSGRPAGSLVRQRIKLETTDSTALFSLRPFYEVRCQRLDEISFNPRDGSLLRNEPQESGDEDTPRASRGSIDYEVLASSTQGMQPGELPPAPNRLQDEGDFVSMPEPIRATLRTVANRALGSRFFANDEQRARALEQFLRDSGEFAYSLRMTPPPIGQDPVVHFLIGTKQGHCEYFASGLALLLRAQGIPSRLVNGFKGGDWNALLRAVNVREKHAHSWVEALVGADGNGQPRWIVLDPTPGLERDRMVARVGGLPLQLQTIVDAIRHRWLYDVVGFDRDRQEQVIYGPIRAFLAQIGAGFALLKELVSGLLARFFSFSRPQDFFSVKGFFVSVTVMTVVAFAFLLARWQVVRWLKIWRGNRLDREQTNSSVPFYARLQRALAALGLERVPAETPREFARRASILLSSRDSTLDSVEHIPEQVVDAFYLVRFGDHSLTPEGTIWLDRRLDALEIGLKHRGTRRAAEISPAGMTSTGRRHAE